MYGCMLQQGIVVKNTDSGTRICVFDPGCTTYQQYDQTGYLNSQGLMSSSVILAGFPKK